MIVIQDDDTGCLWSCPHLEIHEAAATAEYWRSLGIACEVALVPDDWRDLATPTPIKETGNVDESA
jgi:hypothetical protein